MALIIGNKTLDYQQVKSINLDESKNHIPTNEYKTIKFCQEWMSGKTAFRVNTSGTTGKPRQITITRDHMITSAQSTGKTFGLEKGDSALVCLSTDHIAGIMMLVRGFELGLKLTVIPPTSDPLKDFPDNIRFDFTAFVPLQLHTIIKESPEKISILNKMKAIIVGGASVNDSLEKKVQIIKAPVYNTYGMTETASHIAIRRLNGPDRSAFYKIMDGVEIGIDQRNCLKIKSANNKWLITNDLVEISPPTGPPLTPSPPESEKRGIGETEKRGRQFTDSPIHPFIDSVRNNGGGGFRGAAFKWLGRIDNIINSGGVKVQVEKVEAALETVMTKLKHSNRLFVTGLPHPALGKTVAVVFEGKSFSREKKEKIKKALSQVLSKYEIPRYFYYLNKFKETPSGKIDIKKNTSVATI
ncbi:MAG: AMP-binding protein [Cytophagales bacterium]|nr:AMP-binding protein [Cytophagales bacterium]